VENISVVIPAYNRAALISHTLRSLLSQTVPAKEIIVVDDGSTDNTAEVAESFGGQVKVIRQANAGPGPARNAGFRASTGEFIHFFDSDDLAAPNKHAVQLSALKTTGADIAYGPWLKGRFDGNTFYPSNHVFQQNGLPRENDLIKALLTMWSVVPHAALFRRSIVEKAGGFPEDLFVAEDQQMFLMCLLAGAKVVHTPGTIEFYREGDSGKITESQTGRSRRLSEWARFLLKSREACVSRGIDPVGWFGFRRRAWEADDDLTRLGSDDHGLKEQLGSLYRRNNPVSFYRSQRRLERWRGGLQVRLTGGRALNCFRTGSITPEQTVQLQLLGFHLGEAHRGQNGRDVKLTP
jgi:glycosyltransferase involved in cell wall biosynthesis